MSENGEKSKAEGQLDQALDELPKVIDERHALSVQKHKWRKKVRNMDRYIVGLVREDLRGDMRTPIVDYKVTARKICDLGARGEAILDRAISCGSEKHTIEDIRDLLNMLDMWSDKLQQIVTRKWRATPEGWPIYLCDVSPSQELVSQSESIRQLDEMLED